MSCTVHVVSTIISHSKAQQKKTDNSSDSKNTSIAKGWIKHLAEAKPAKALLQRVSIVQIKPKAPQI
ncbi:hypothetical protein [Candidatus Rhabdochlamydia sp. T3358]|uniref:hypothetical protein n=1 Tax=Candidatus Rhabdochlamydia sp. T3358 TaxID=2099795 RepID=UPI0010B5F7FD|nr:hypothetical protein [Candidatus Rhabdochlamydia sp. T3358]VHN99665.1 hypothetical protein RHT_00098 [Candidatus Rhabdochlamydia sp. T3358]